MKKVLIAEDDHFLASAYRVKLEGAGFEIKLTDNGEQALTLAESFKPDYILLDLVMPGKDGFWALSALRAKKEFAKTKIIVASNLSQEEDRAKALALGADHYIVKSETPLAEIVKLLSS